MNSTKILSWIVLAAIFISARSVMGGDLHDAAMLGETDKIKTLLQARPELVNSRDDNHRTALHYAAQRGNKEICAILLSYKADINAKVEERTPDGIAGWTPLHLAAERGRVAVVEFLISQGANIEAKDAWGRTPLFLAAVGGQVQAMQVLVAHKASVNVRDKLGKTPLQRAIEAENIEVYRFLHDNGAQE